MSNETDLALPSKAKLWSGYLLSAAPAAMLLMSGIMKLVQPPMLVEGFADLGWPIGVATALGVVEIGCVVLYAIPKTSVLGAILLTGYLGGAIATHVRINDGFLIPVILGIVIWLGLYLRDIKLRELIPIRS